LLEAARMAVGAFVRSLTMYRDVEEGNVSAQIVESGAYPA
jgi:hypothetical protein